LFVEVHTAVFFLLSILASAVGTLQGTHLNNVNLSDKIEHGLV